MQSVKQGSTLATEIQLAGERVPARTHLAVRLFLFSGAVAQQPRPLRYPPLRALHGVTVTGRAKGTYDEVEQALVEALEEVRDGLRNDVRLY